MATAFPQFHKLSAKLPKRLKTTTPAINDYLREALIDERTRDILTTHGVYPTFNEREPPRSKAERTLALQDLSKAERRLKTVSSQLDKLRGVRDSRSDYPDAKEASRVLHYVGNFLLPIRLDIRSKSRMIQLQGIKSRKNSSRSS